MKVTFNGVKLKAKKRKKELLKKFSAVIDSGIFLNGSENEKLVNTLTKYFGGGHVITTESGHSALLLALHALNLKPTDEVIFPVNVYPTAFAVSQSGAKPVPVDVDSNGLIEQTEIVKKITKYTKAIVLVHLYGLVVDIDKIKNIIRGKNIRLIEDCAQSLGSSYKNKPIGTLADISCFSFYPTKNLGTLGNGGAIWCRKEEHYNYFKKAVAYGAKALYKSEFVSGHSRLPELQAAVLNIYLKDFKKESTTRQKILKDYLVSFKKYDLLGTIRILLGTEISDSQLHLLVIECPQRDSLASYLTNKKIETHIHYPQPIHLLKAFAHLEFQQGNFPKSEYLSNHILSLPFHPYITTREIKYVVKSIKEFYA